LPDSACFSTTGLAKTSEQESDQEASEDPRDNHLPEDWPQDSAATKTAVLKNDFWIRILRPQTVKLQES
jgi:hypothetical protein